MFVYDYEESYSYYLNMFLDKDDHSTVINYLNSKEFYLSIGIINSSFGRLLFYVFNNTMKL